MPTAHVQLHSALSPAQALGVLIDFSPNRLNTWPGIDADHFEVHDSGDGWADITEGNDSTWERVRYTWDSTKYVVDAETVDSNVWAAGQGWHYTFSPEGAGSLVDVTLTRQGKTTKSKAIAALLPVLGASALKKSFKSPLQTT